MRQVRISEAGVKFGTSGVRGLVSELTAEVCYAYTLAFCEAVSVRSRVVIGHDLRPSSPLITRACIQALTDRGLEVVYVGALPTPAIACYASQLNTAALVVTGSHIPFDRNGIKFYRAEGEITKADEAAIATASVQVPDRICPAELPQIDHQAEQAYLHRYLDFFAADLCAGMRVAIYQHSSVARDLLARLFRKLGAEVIELGRTESFVPIDTEAVREEDRLQALAWAAEPGFDILLSTDGDADRPLIGDEQGMFLRGDVVGALTAHFIGADAVVTPVSSNTLVERSGWFPQVVRTRIGSPYVLAAMADVKGTVVGYEANGGFLLGSTIREGKKRLEALPTRDALLPMLALIALAKSKACRISELRQSLPQRFTASDRIPQIPTQWSAGLLAALRSGELDLQTLLPVSLGELVNVDETDGYRVSFRNGCIVHLRPSGNAPELRCYVEADSETEAQEVCQDTLRQIAEYYRSSQEV